LATLTVWVTGAWLVDEAVDEYVALEAALVVVVLWAETTDDPRSRETRTVKRVRRQFGARQVIVR
jgi:hypothetical protein